ncbi:outer membrane protein transport protein, partial [Pantoea sp. SIMBA_133]
RGGSDITESGDDVRRRDLVQPLEFEDSYRFGVGASYAWDDRLTLRTGASFDQSPLRNSDFRTPRGPDNDRYIVGLGASYQWWDNLSVDL